MSYAVAAILGLIVGRVVRWATPRVVRCKDKSLPFSWPWVELVTALVFVLVVLRFGWSQSTPKWFIFAGLLLLTTATDSLTKYVYIPVLRIGTVVGVFLSVAIPFDIGNLLRQYQIIDSFNLGVSDPHIASGILSILGLLMGYIIMEFVRRVFRGLVQMEVMGEGDSLIMMMIGAFIGPKAVIYALLVASIIGAVTGMISKMVTKQPHAPFGPPLAAAGMIMAVFGNRLVDILMNFNQTLYQVPPMVLMGFSIFLLLVLVVMIIRLKKRAPEYEKMIEENYKEIDSKLED